MYILLNGYLVCEAHRDVWQGFDRRHLSMFAFICLQSPGVA